jgi:inosine-uridine nucleoside N-ribohydrolase
MKSIIVLLTISTLVFFSTCNTQVNDKAKIAVLMDTDANNEVDDQHALAYLLLNGSTFDVSGVTVNTTQNGGEIESQYAEAKRVMQLCDVFGEIPLYKGANGSFTEIRPFIHQDTFDGSDAVNFIVEQANKARKEKIVLLPVGKLTNIALALEKDNTIADKVKIVWLGSNYPEPGEYNQDNDTAAMNYILSKKVPFEIVTVRGSQNTGTAFVRVTWDEISTMMPGLGPVVEPVEGRHGGTFTTFGDYSVNLFKHCDYYGNPPARSLFDMAAVAILKNPEFAASKTIPAPVLVDGNWVEQPENKRMISIWENFDRDAIVKDFQESMVNYVIAVKEK